MGRKLKSQSGIEHALSLCHLRPSHKSKVTKARHDSESCSQSSYTQELNLVRTHHYMLACTLAIFSHVVNKNNDIRIGACNHLPSKRKVISDRFVNNIALAHYTTIPRLIHAFSVCISMYVRLCKNDVRCASCAGSPSFAILINSGDFAYNMSLMITNGIYTAMNPHYVSTLTRYGMAPSVITRVLPSECLIACMLLQLANVALLCSSFWATH